MDKVVEVNNTKTYILDLNNNSNLGNKQDTVDQTSY